MYCDASLPLSERVVSINVTETGSTPATYKFVGSSYSNAFYGQASAVSTASDRTISISITNMPPAGGSYSTEIYTGSCSTVTDQICTAINVDDYVDNVVVSSTSPAPVPSLSEWAMIMFATLLAGAAALTLHRRRQVA